MACYWALFGVRCMVMMRVTDTTTTPLVCNDPISRLRLCRRHGCCRALCTHICGGNRSAQLPFTRPRQHTPESRHGRIPRACKPAHASTDTWRLSRRRRMQAGRPVGYDRVSHCLLLSARIHTSKRFSNTLVPQSHTCICSLSRLAWLKCTLVTYGGARRGRETQLM